MTEFRHEDKPRRGPKPRYMERPLTGKERSALHRRRTRGELARTREFFAGVEHAAKCLEEEAGIHPRRTAEHRVRMAAAAALRGQVP